MLAPKLSALQDAFDPRDVKIVAIYVETCDGVDDHAAELRRQVLEHGLEYTVLNGEAGTLDDPAHKRMRGIPHAVLIDARGRIVTSYDCHPRVDLLRPDLEAVAGTGRLPHRAADAWRNFEKGAWVETRVEAGARSRKERRRLVEVSSDGVRVEVVVRPDAGDPQRREEKLFLKNPAPERRGYRRSELEARDLVVDDRRFRCRVFEATWTRVAPDGAEFRVQEKSWYATDARLDEMLLRRETVERGAQGIVTTRIRKLESFVARETIADRPLICWRVGVVGTGPEGRWVERTWYARTVPGLAVKRVHRSRDHAEVSRVVAFGTR